MLYLYQAETRGHCTVVSRQHAVPVPGGDSSLSFKPARQSSVKDEGEVENVRVVVRVRPLSAREREAGYRQIMQVDTVNNSICVENPQAADGEPPKMFTFDSVFDMDSRQVRLGHLT
uniref:Kinesin motor domain-containing protein n=1 Tax=Timema monikensis TaxID=170555 RepID=A0A7R9E905_9NEOP|nr:unnamed protein product [Timema monikensis]